MTEKDIQAITQAVISALDLPTQESEPVVTEEVVAPAPVKRTKEDNQKANRTINGHLASATRFAKAGETAKMQASLKKAMSAVPTHKTKTGVLAWQSTVDRIEAKAKTLVNA